MPLTTTMQTHSQIPIHIRMAGLSILIMPLAVFAARLALMFVPQIVSVHSILSSVRRGGLFMFIRKWLGVFSTNVNILFTFVYVMFGVVYLCGFFVVVLFLAMTKYYVCVFGSLVVKTGWTIWRNCVHRQCCLPNRFEQSVCSINSNYHQLSGPCIYDIHRWILEIEQNSDMLIVGERSCLFKMYWSTMQHYYMESVWMSKRTQRPITIWIASNHWVFLIEYILCHDQSISRSMKFDEPTSSVQTMRPPWWKKYYLKFETLLACEPFKTDQIPIME